MPSPLNDPRSEDWFRRFNAPLKCLPAEERAALHTEVSQHLDALAAANIELGSSPEEAWKYALTQFGDPARIGRRLLWEWRRSRCVITPDMVAVLYGLAAHVVLTFLLLPATFLVMTAAHFDTTMRTLVHWEYWLVVPLLTGAMMGRRFPKQAVTAAFYITFTLPMLPMVLITALLMAQTIPADLFAAFLWPPAWLTLGCGAAYLASVTRRGWYRPALADFKLSLPQKKARA